MLTARESSLLQMIQTDATHDATYDIHRFTSFPYSVGRVPVNPWLTRKSNVSNLVRLAYSTGKVPSWLMKLRDMDDKLVIRPNSVGRLPNKWGAILISNTSVLFMRPISVGRVPDKRWTSPRDKVSVNAWSWTKEWNSRRETKRKNSQRWLQLGELWPSGIARVRDQKSSHLTQIFPGSNLSWDGATELAIPDSKEPQIRHLNFSWNGSFHTRAGNVDELKIRHSHHKFINAALHFSVSLQFNMAWQRNRWYSASDSNKCLEKLYLLENTTWLDLRNVDKSNNDVGRLP